MRILRWIDRKLNEWWARDMQRQFDKERVKVKVERVKDSAVRKAGGK